jgi:ABC-type cobalamin transport system permease subunit
MLADLAVTRMYPRSQAAFARLLPKWLVVVGIAIAVAGELGWISLVIPQTLFLIPLTRFPAFLRMIAVAMKRSINWEDIPRTNRF